MIVGDRGICGDLNKNELIWDALVGICVAIFEEVLTPGSVSTFLCVCGSRCSDQLLLQCHV